MYYRDIESNIKSCIYVFPEGRYKGIQCRRESASEFCCYHLSNYYIYKKGYLKIISSDKYDKYDVGKIITFYNTKNNEQITKMLHNKTWIGMGNTTKDIKTINIFNFTYFGYKYRIKKWVEMFLVFKHLIGEEAYDIWTNMVHYYLYI